MKILFGGTFDPIHNGHIALARYISQQFNHHVSLLPLNGVPNYKKPPLASLTQRLAMLQLIANQYPEQIEIDYSEAGLTEYSPTVYTLQRLRQKYGNEMPFYFIIGGDSLVTLDIWDEWQKLFGLTNFIVAARPNYPLNKMSAELQQEVMPRITEDTQQRTANGRIIMTHFEPIELSSTMIRAHVARQTSIAGMVDGKIQEYINEQQLYR